MRGNGGGRRDPILEVVPRLMEPDDPPRVVNVAAFRLEPGDDPEDPQGFLANRFLWPRDWDGWTDAERAAIDRFMTRFRPEWTPPDGDFSAWHFMVVSPGPPDRPRFGGPVVVLMDEACFSATDIFLGALKGMPRVTLVGAPSSGGSAKAVTHRIGRASVRLASMASFQPNGKTYDGHGIQPDVAVLPEPNDLAGSGENDAQLDRALEILADH